MPTALSQLVSRGLLAGMLQAVLLGFLGGTALPTAGPVPPPEAVRRAMTGPLGFPESSIRRVGGGAPAVHVPEPHHPRDVVVFGVLPLEVPPGFVADYLDRRGYMPEVSVLPLVRTIPVSMEGGFPEAVELPYSDLLDLEGCRAGDCALKLGGEEIDALRSGPLADGTAGEREAGLWFRGLLERRLGSYLEHGTAALPVYADRPAPAHPDRAFRELLARHEPAFEGERKALRYLASFEGLPAVTRAGSSPAAARGHGPAAESEPPREGSVRDLFFRFREEFGRKEVIGLAHGALLVPSDDTGHTVLAVRRLYTSHYYEASLETFVLVGGEGSGEVRSYLLYARRMRVDTDLNRLTRNVLELRLAPFVEGMLEEWRTALEEAYREGEGG